MEVQRSSAPLAHARTNPQPAQPPPDLVNAGKQTGAATHAHACMRTLACTARRAPAPTHLVDACNVLERHARVLGLDHLKLGPTENLVALLLAAQAAHTGGGGGGGEGRRVVRGRAAANARSTPPHITTAVLLP